MSRPLTPPEQERVICLYLGGATAREIATALGRSKSGIVLVIRRHGVAVRPAKPRDIVGDKNPNWKGGRFVDDAGYVHVWTPNGYRLEHRMVAAAPPGTVVHHRDGDRSNNLSENLEVLPSHEVHRAMHVAEQRAALGKALYPAPRPGESHPRAKLTLVQVGEIRSLRGVVSQRELALRYGVSKTAVRYAQTGRNWRHARPSPRPLPLPEVTP